MSVKVAINGFGRIGRLVLRAIMESGRKDIEVVGINDLGPVETNAHLFRHDTVHGKFPGIVRTRKPAAANTDAAASAKSAEPCRASRPTMTVPPACPLDSNHCATP